MRIFTRQREAATEPGEANDLGRGPRYVTPATDHWCDLHRDRRAVAHYDFRHGPAMHLWACGECDEDRSARQLEAAGGESIDGSVVRETEPELRSIFRENDCYDPDAHGQALRWIHPLAVLNTSIATADGSYTLRTVSAGYARDLIGRSREILSAVGHEATAQALSEILGTEVPVNRIQFEQQPGQVALVFKLRGRLPEGQVLTLEQLEKVGYDLKVMERTE